MKKITLFLIGLILIGIPSYADTRASILLLHNGQGSSFEDDQLQDAVNQAVTGDTICLSEGTYNISTPLIIDKIISIIGTGETTKLEGSIYINIDETTNLTNNMLSCLRISGDVIAQKELDGLKLKKAWIGGVFSASSELNNVQLDRCYIYRIVPTSYIKSALIHNCVINSIDNSSSYSVDSKGNDVTFFNCSIYKIGNMSKINDVTFVNSIIVTYDGNSICSNNTFIYCLSKYGISTSFGNILDNCYTDSSINVTVNAYNDGFPTFKYGSGVASPEINKELLEEKGYLGNDGTAVGAYGGSTPYTLEADGIQIKESVLKVDPVTRQLNVILKVE